MYNFAFADKSLSGQPIMYCPETLNCEKGFYNECEISDINGIWGRPFSEHNWEIQKGIYSLQSAYSIDASSGTAYALRCEYKIDKDSKDTINIKVGRDFRDKFEYYRYYSPVRYKHYISDTSKWKDRLTGLTECNNDEEQTKYFTKKCPFVEISGIYILTRYTEVVDGRSRQRSKKSLGPHFLLPFDRSQWKFEQYDAVDSKTLNSFCKHNSHCMIDIGTCGKKDQYCEIWGTVTVDASNEEKMTMENPLPRHMVKLN